MADKPPSHYEQTRGRSQKASRRKKGTQGPSQPPALGAGSSSTDHSTFIPAQPRETGGQYGNTSGASLQHAGVLERPPTQEWVDSATVQEIPLKASKRWRQIPIEHNAEIQARIDALSDQERKTVVFDGGNSVLSQLEVLKAIEKRPCDNHTNRLWTETTHTGTDGKRKTRYHCREGCDHPQTTAQRARQHFVATHVEDAGWKCPYEGCHHTRKHKRLDDLKNHHMLPNHQTDYFRGRPTVVPLETPGAGPSYGTRASNRRNQGSSESQEGDHGVGPHRTNDVGTSRGKPGSVANPYSIHRRPRYGARASPTPSEHNNGTGFNTEGPPSDINYHQSLPDLGLVPATSPLSTTFEATSHPNPTFTEETPQPPEEPSYQFSPFNELVDHQPAGVSQGSQSSLTLHSMFETEGSTPTTHPSMSPQYARSEPHAMAQLHEDNNLGHEESPLRMRRRNGEQGSDPPLPAEYISPRDHVTQESGVGVGQNELTNAVLPDHRASHFDYTIIGHAYWLQNQQGRGVHAYRSPQSPSITNPGSPYNHPTYSDPSQSPQDGYYHPRPPQQTPLPSGSPQQAYFPPRSPQRPSNPSQQFSFLYPFNGTNASDYVEPPTPYESTRWQPHQEMLFYTSENIVPNPRLSPLHSRSTIPTPQATPSSSRFNEQTPYDESDLSPLDNPDHHT